MSQRSAFGLPMEFSEEAQSEDPFPDEAAETVAETPEEAPESPVEPETALDEAEQPAEEAQEPSETEEEPEVPAERPYEGRYSEKYPTIEALEKAHQSILAEGQAQLERNRQLEADNIQLAQYLQVAAQRMQEAQAQPAPVVPIEQQAEQMGVDPEVLRAAQMLVEQQVNPLKEQLAQQQNIQTQQALEQRQVWEMQQTREAVTSYTKNFKETHADLDAKTEDMMVRIFNPSFNPDGTPFFNPDGSHNRLGLGLDPTNPDNYEIALEAARDPALAQVLAVNPGYIETEEGLDLARKIARLSAPAAPVVTKDSREDELAAARRKATVESGASGAPIGEEEERPKDLWDEVTSMDVKPKSAFGI